MAFSVPKEAVLKQEAKEARVRARKRAKAVTKRS
jgi:hypothetical protein